MKDKKNSKDKIYFSSNKFEIIKKQKEKYHLYISVDKWFLQDKIYYKFDYVLENKHSDIIPDKKIKTNSPILSHLQIDNNLGEINIYHIPKIRPFEFSGNLNYKVVSTVIEVGLNEKVNILEKLFSDKKLYVKNNFTKEKLLIVNKKDTDGLDLLLSNMLDNLTIDDSQNNND